MAKCSGITRSGTACKGTPIGGSQWCYVHHPDHAEERRRHGARGGKRGGRGRPPPELAWGAGGGGRGGAGPGAGGGRRGGGGRPSSERARLQRRFEELADKVLNGEVE